MERTHWGVFGAAGLIGGWLWARKLRRRFPLDGKVVLLTGGSRGLGLEIARAIARRGGQLALVARDGEELARAVQVLQVDGAEVFTVECDVRMQDQVQRAVRLTTERFGRVDVLINNAGVIQIGPVETMRVADFQEAMDTHFFGPLYAIQAVLPQMRARREGRIVNVASVGGKVAAPHLLPYDASKFALVGLSEGLHAELKKDGVVVTTVCPGLVRTGSPRNVFVKGRTRAEYGWFTVLDSLPWFSMAADSAAAAIVRACERGDSEVILTGRARTAARLNGLAPGLMAEVLGWVNRHPALPDPGAGWGRVRGRARAASRIRTSSRAPTAVP